MNAVLPKSVESLVIDPNLMTPLSRGKVRDTYDIGNGYLLVVTTDRISVFDVVLPCFVPRKGEVLNAVSLFWKILSGVIENKRHDVVAYGRDIERFLPKEFKHRDNTELYKRAVVVTKLDMLPIEAIVRGFLTGSGFRDYKETGRVCGIVLPPGLHDGSKLQEPIFTPSSKAEFGHDENINADNCIRDFGEEPKIMAIRAYQKAQVFAQERGIIIADTKFELGRDPRAQLFYADEILTPDSSRFWNRDEWRFCVANGRKPESQDKEYVRNWAMEQGINKLDPENSDDLAHISSLTIPDEIIAGTTKKYVEIEKKLLDMSLDEFQASVLL